MRQIPFTTASNFLSAPIMGITAVVGFNDRSSVVGTVGTPRGLAAVFCNGACTGLMSPPATLSNPLSSYAIAINDYDDVIGVQSSFMPSPITDGFLWANATPGGLGIGLSSPIAINTARQSSVSSAPTAPGAPS